MQLSNSRYALVQHMLYTLYYQMHRILKDCDDRDRQTNHVNNDCDDNAIKLDILSTIVNNKTTVIYKKLTFCRFIRLVPLW